jgi:hypothetical protein
MVLVKIWRTPDKKSRTELSDIVLFNTSGCKEVYKSDVEELASLLFFGQKTPVATGVS